MPPLGSYFLKSGKEEKEEAERYIFLKLTNYAPNNLMGHILLFRHFAPFLVDPVCQVIVGDCNIILDSKVHRGRRASGSLSGRVDLIDEFGFVDRYRVGQPVREMWPPIQIAPSLDRMLVRWINLNLLDCPTFHCIRSSDSKLR